MPKAAVDEHNGTVTRQDDVGQVGAVQTKPEPFAMQPTAHEELRLGVPVADLPHDAGTRLFVENVRQAVKLSGQITCRPG